MTVRLAWGLAALTFILLLVGGTVHATGASLACPDWPLCYGEVFPRMRDGVLIEHSHRLLASLVGFTTLLLAGVAAWQRLQGPTRRFALAALGAALLPPALLAWGLAPQPPLLGPQLAAWAGVALVLLAGLAVARRDRVAGLALVAVSLVVAQGMLGGTTVAYRLPLLVSTAHLALSLTFFSLVLYLAHYLAGRLATEPTSKWLVAAVAAVALQAILGALVRHTASGMACGTDILSCNGALSGHDGPSWTHWLHRLWALASGALILRATWSSAWGKQGGVWQARFAQVVLVAQVLLGVLTVKFFLAAPYSISHLGAAALLLAALLSLSWSSRRSPVGATYASPAATLATVQG